MANYIKNVQHLAENGADPNKDAAVIVNPNRNASKQILGIGWNTKEKGVHFHATLTAIVNAAQNLEGCTLYVRYYPCNECAKQILVSGIKKVVYIEDEFEDAFSEDIAKELFEKREIKEKMNFSIKKWAEGEIDIKNENDDENDDMSDEEIDIKEELNSSEDKKRINHKKFMAAAMEAGIYTDYISETRTQKSGACIVYKDYKTIISEGRARFPCDGLGFQPREKKHLYVLHSESRAIIEAYKNGKDLKDCIIYCTDYPSMDCGPLIVKSGIGRVIYKKDFEPKFDFEPFGNIKVEKYDDIMQPTMTE